MCACARARPIRHRPVIPAAAAAAAAAAPSRGEGRGQVCLTVAQNVAFAPALQDNELRAGLNVTDSLVDLGEASAPPVMGALLAGAGAGAEPWNYSVLVVGGTGAGRIALQRVGMYSLEVMVGAARARGARARV